jgi:hypothetical protein
MKAQYCREPTFRNPVNFKQDAFARRFSTDLFLFIEIRSKQEDFGAAFYPSAP